MIGADHQEDQVLIRELGLKPYPPTSREEIVAEG